MPYSVPQNKEIRANLERQYVEMCKYELKHKGIPYTKENHMKLCDENEDLIYAPLSVWSKRFQRICEEREQKLKKKD